MTTEISEGPQVEKEGIFQERGNKVRRGRGGTRIGGLNRGWNGDQDKGGDREMNNCTEGLFRSCMEPYIHP